ncbi:(Fe-S)-binding protein [Bradyrhizobium oligotrophicum S58]
MGGARQAFVKAGLGPKDLLQAADNSRDHGSPLGVTADKLRDRIEWLEDEHDVPIALDKDKADILLTLSSVETMKYPDSVVAMAKLLNHAGVDWTLSTKGYEATNFGYLAGKADVAGIMVQRITEAAEAVGAKTVVIPECGHAFGVLRWSGANMLGRPLPFAVVHISEFMAQLKRDGRLRLKPLEESITYHDPCQISRRGGATEDARFLLQDFAKDFREMTPTGNLNWCCGGGGGGAGDRARS